MGTVDIEEYLRKLDENGHEVPDPRPVQIPAGFKKPETLAEQVQRLVRGHLSRQAAMQGMETFEEAEDFEVEDDPLPQTPYETNFDPILGRDLSPQEFRQNEAIYRQRYLKAQEAYFQALERNRRLEGVLDRGSGEAPRSAPKQAGEGAPPARPMGVPETVDRG